MKIRKLLRRAAAFALAAVTALSAVPATTAFAAGDIGTISFTHTYDGAGNAMRYNSSANIGGHTAGGTGEYKYRMYVDGETAFCLQPGVPLKTGNTLAKASSNAWNALSAEQRKAVGLALLVLFFVVGVMRTCGDFAQVKKPEHAVKLFIRFALAKGAVTYGLELMMALFKIVQGLISTIMNAAGFGSAQQTVLPSEIVTAVEDCGFFESIPLWAVTLIGGLFITVLSFIMIMSVYGRFFKLYLYTAIAPVPLSSFAGEPSQNVGRSFIKSYCAVCLEGAIIVLACIIFSVFAASPPVVNPDAAAVTMVWGYIGELVFNMLVLVGAVKMADRVVREMMGL